jgi:hypothetical protein
MTTRKSTPWDDFGNEVDMESAKNKQGPKCRTCQLLTPGALPHEAAQQLFTVLNKQDVTSTAIRRALLKRVSVGVPSAYSISRHRRGECRGELDV